MKNPLVGTIYLTGVFLESMELAPREEVLIAADGCS
jgi:hypothetical protein